VKRLVELDKPTRPANRMSMKKNCGRHGEVWKKKNQNARLLLNLQLLHSFEVNLRPNFIPDFRHARGSDLTAQTFCLRGKIAEGCNHPCSFCIIPQKWRRLASLAAAGRHCARGAATRGGRA